MFNSFWEFGSQNKEAKQFKALKIELENWTKRILKDLNVSYESNPVDPLTCNIEFLDF